MALNSKTNLKIIDAICEGPIEGLAEWRKSVLLNETLVTGRQIGQTVSFATREGTQDQKRFDESSLLGNDQTTIIDVNQQLGSNYSEELNDNNQVVKRDYGTGQITRAINDSEADFVVLVFTIPKLYCTAMEGLARGQLFFAQIKLDIALSEDGGAFEDKWFRVEGQAQRNIIKGVSTSQYQFKTKPFNLSRNKAPYKIRVRKVEFDSAEDAFEIKYTDFQDLPGTTPLANNRADTIIWNSIIVGKRIKVSYPHTALVHLSIDSEEYNTLPARAYDIKGLKVQIPSNATVRRDGSLRFDNSIPFDGSLTTNLHWTTCPICCFYDLLTNDRYGAGDFVDKAKVNWVDLIDLAKYCNEEIDTPEGRQPRFAINTVLGSQAEAYNVLQDMASVFRGMIFWKADNVQIAADHGNLGEHNAEPLAAIHVFSNSNVVNGSFSYNGSSLKARSTRVRVRYNDPDNFYKPNFLIIEDQAAIEKYGVQEKSVVAFGCTSKYQAQRMARWVLHSETVHDDTVNFSVGLEGLNVLPGQIFEVSDEMRLSTRLAGRIVGARRGFVDLDQPPVMPSGANDKISVVMKDGTIETRPIFSDQISGNRVTLVSPFTQVPPDDALYSITNDSAVLRKYRCLSVAEGDGGVYSVIGVRHVDGLYKFVEGDSATLDLPKPFIYGRQPDSVSDVNITFQQIDNGTSTTNRATISWSRGLTGPVADFEVRWRIGNAGNWNIIFTANTSVDIDTNILPGEILYAEVTARGPQPDRKRSDIGSQSREMPVPGTSDGADGVSKIVIPPDPEEVTIEASGVDQVILRWSPTASGQNVANFVAVIRHSSKLDGTGIWPNSTLLRKVSARTTSVLLPLMNGEYLVKFENAQKQRSRNAVSALINLPDAIPRFNFEVFREDADYGAFPGQSSNVYYNDTYDGLVLSGNGDFDAVLNVDQFDSVNTLAATALVDGEQYAILSAGTTDFTVIGASDNNIGTIFTATGPGSGTGTVYGYFDFIGEQVLKGEYFFYNIVDLGARYSVKMRRVLTARGLYLSDLIDDRTENIDIWSDFDGEIPDGTDVQVYFRREDKVKMTANPSVADPEILYEDGSKIQFEGSTVTLAVTVVSSGGNKYRIDGSSTDNETLTLKEGNIYIFDQSDASNSGHPLKISEVSDGTHNGGSAYTTGVTTVGTPGTAGAYTQIVLNAGAPTLYYYCSAHSGMGGQLNTDVGASYIRQESDIFFEEWIPLENNSYVGRYFQFKAELITERNDQTPLVDELGVTFQLERRSENSKYIDSGLGPKSVTFDKAFYVDGNTSVSVGITALDFDSQDYYVMPEPTAEGFTITFKGTSGSNTFVNRRFSYTAVGYGTRED